MQRDVVCMDGSTVSRVDVVTKICEEVETFGGSMRIPTYEEIQEYELGSTYTYQEGLCYFINDTLCRLMISGGRLQSKTKGVYARFAKH